MLEFQGITKSFGSLLALDSVSLQIEDGEIHAVLGENGAGKSTLMSILSGFLTPDTGKILYNGRALSFGNPLESKRRGIEMVHQHFTLVPAFNAEENLALYRLNTLFRTAKPLKVAQPALELAAQLGWQIPLGRAAKDLSVGTQQRIEILKALSRDARILILDEPTAVLSSSEIEDLFQILRKLREQGRTILLIAHKLAEVMSVADRATVLRKGKWIATSEIAQTSEKALAEWMVGAMPEVISKSSSRNVSVALKASDLRILGDRNEERVKGVSFSISKGEILGVGGVEGNGQIELAQTLALVRRFASGSITWLARPLNESEIILGYIPQDRHLDGLALNMSVADNLLIDGHRRRSLRVGPILKSRRIRTWASELVQRFSIAATSIDDSVSSLSGGNQQKVVVARALDSVPDLLIAVNPTRGLDLQATNYVHRQILSARENGAAVVLFSSDLDELAALADRTAYMSNGAFSDTIVGGVA